MNDRALAFSATAALLAGLLLAACQATSGSTSDPATADLSRRYRDGERFTYAMTAVNQDRLQTQRYRATAAVQVHEQGGGFVEEIDWRQLAADGKDVALPPAGAAVHQQLSLAAGHRWAPPDLAHVDPHLIGPVLDLMTFYVDLWLATKDGRLRRAGDHLLVPRNTPNSWADGRHVVLGEDAIDFDITLVALDAAGQTATVLVRHVPPAQPAVKLPAAWMRQPVADTPNNWVEVHRGGKDGNAFVAAVGKETFDVELRVGLADGQILRASMDNVVDVLERTCADAALDDPGAPVRYRIHRQIELRKAAAGSAGG